MPVHRVPATHLEEDLRQIQREGETITSVVANDGYFVVVTEFVTPGVETR
jgi:archaeosine-15-forming tRNA-guanine transglycosylase